MMSVRDAGRPTIGTSFKKFISPNSFVKPYLGGVILYDSDQLEPFHSVSDMFSTRCHVFFTSKDHEIVDINELCLSNFDYASKIDAVGDTFARNCQDKLQILKVFDNDRQVIKARQLQVFEEMADLNNGKHMHTITYKVPWYSQNQELLGIFGYAVVLSDRSFSEIADAITHFSKFLIGCKQLSKFKEIGSGDTKQYFSPREMDVFRLLVRGKTARQMGEILGLSPRTVETYLQNMKIKANVSSKSQLIDKLIDWL
jgi:DNA-binding CsgD family transcriptional regulator